MLVKCINDSDKPEEIRQKNWIKKDKVYTVVNTLFHPIQHVNSFVLEEVSPDAPYIGYLTTRFEPLVEVDLKELLKEQTEKV